MGKLVAAMKQDKKVWKGRLRFILPESLGKVFITEEVDLSLVEQALTG
jgi:3-dehydroquinate synthetase